MKGVGVSGLRFSRTFFLYFILFYSMGLNIVFFMHPPMSISKNKPHTHPYFLTPFHFFISEKFLIIFFIQLEGRVWGPGKFVETSVQI